MALASKWLDSNILEKAEERWWNDIRPLQIWGSTISVQAARQGYLVLANVRAWPSGGKSLRHTLSWWSHIDLVLVSQMRPANLRQSRPLYSTKDLRCTDTNMKTNTNLIIFQETQKYQYFNIFFSIIIIEWVVFKLHQK